MKNQPIKILAMIPVALLFASSIAPVNAETFMINFGTASVPGGEATNSPLHTVNGTFTGSTWNEIDQASDGSGLLDAESGGATGVDLDLGLSGVGTLLVNFTSNPPDTFYANFAQDGGVYDLTTLTSALRSANSNSSQIAIGGELTGLAAGEYEVYIWGNFGSDTANGPMATYVGTGAAASTYDFTSITGSNISNNTSGTPAWTEGLSYSKTTITLSDTDSLYFAIQGVGGPSQQRAWLSGVQVAAIPEPSTLMLVSIAGLLGVLGLRRKGRSNLR